MQDLQLATTLVAPTGTGLLYSAYDQRGDSAKWKNGVGADRSEVLLKRTQAKPTSVFPGVERFDLKRAIYHTIDGVEYVAVVNLVTSIPVPMTGAQRTAIHLHAALLAQDDIFKDAIETGVIPT
jgi:hypothetical protein